MNPSQLTVGQIGLGGYGGHRRDLMRQTGLVRLAAAYDTNPATLEAAVQEEGCRAITSYEELLDVEGMQGVAISTGAKFHTEQIIEALERGLPVFLEKPVCCNEDEAIALVEAKKRHNVGGDRRGSRPPRFSCSKPHR